MAYRVNRVQHVAVLIPARDEEVLLPRCLHSVQAARCLLPEYVTSDVVVVSDCSTDRTHDIAQEILGDSGVVLCADAGTVGSARALAARVALERFHGQAAACWLANTDADCQVPPLWLAQQVDLAHSGASAVAGIVDVDDFTGHLPHVSERFRKTYLIHADGTHPHVHGANLGVRSDAYLQAGGWGEFATAEDHDLWRRLRAFDSIGCLADARLRVLTSGRRVGRAPLGFAGALAAHNDLPLREVAA